MFTQLDLQASRQPGGTDGNQRDVWLADVARGCLSQQMVCGRWLTVPKELGDSILHLRSHIGGDDQSVRREEVRIRLEQLKGILESDTG